LFIHIPVLEHPESWLKFFFFPVILRLAPFAFPHMLFSQVLSWLPICVRKKKVMEYVSHTLLPTPEREIHVFGTTSVVDPNPSTIDSVLPT